VSKEDTDVCIQQLGTDQFHWFDAADHDWDTVMDHFDDHEAQHEYIVVDAGGPYAEIMKEVSPDRTFEVARFLKKYDDNFLWLFVDNVGVSYFLKNMEDVAMQAEDAFAGVCDSPEDWAYSFHEECGFLQEVPDNLRMYIDWEAVARDAGQDGILFIEYEGEIVVFYNF